jgi:cell shape-determining protein MreD
MRYFKLLVLVVLVLVLSFGLLPALGLSHALPALLLLTVLVLALESDTADMVLVAFLGGIWTDIFVGLPIGSYALGLVTVGLCVTAIFRYLLFARVSVWQFIVLTIGAVFGLWLWLLVYPWLLFWFGLHVVVPAVESWVKLLLPTLFATLLAAYPVYAGILLLLRWGRPKSDLQV